MNNWIQFGDTAPIPTDLPTLVLALLLAYMSGQLLAWVYMYTHSGLSYSRNFVSSLIIIPITVSMVMMVLDNNLVTAFSLLAVFAIVRFRNILRDTLDTVYILSLIVIGMAAGTQKFATAAIGIAHRRCQLVRLTSASAGGGAVRAKTASSSWHSSQPARCVSTAVVSRAGSRPSDQAARTSAAGRSVSIRTTAFR